MSFQSNETPQRDTGTKHLDLGCGASPRNPFHAKHIYAIDMAQRKDSDLNNIKFVSANLALDNIPFPDDYFDSVSAYDFLEHIPRLLHADQETFFPFIRLMSEVHRVLKPGGAFYAITPLYPKESAFVDPTHVNFISKDTYKYFTEPHVWAEMYGFTGTFSVKRVETVNFDYEVSPRQGLVRFIKWIICTLFPKSKQHIVWHFTAAKSGILNK
jgi:SAM-dependent methyltransferase